MKENKMKEIKLSTFDMKYADFSEAGLKVADLKGTCSPRMLLLNNEEAQKDFVNFLKKLERHKKIDDIKRMLLIMTPGIIGILVTILLCLYAKGV